MNREQVKRIDCKNSVNDVSLYNVWQLLDEECRNISVDYLHSESAMSLRKRHSLSLYSTCNRQLCVSDAVYLAYKTNFLAQELAILVSLQIAMSSWDCVCFLSGVKLKRDDLYRKLIRVFLFMC